MGCSKKLVMILILILVGSLIAVASHENFPTTDWTSPAFEPYKNEDKCKCFSEVDAILKNRNKKIDAVGLAKACYTYCTHCVPKTNARAGTTPFHITCSNKCLETPQYNTEISIVACLDGCRQSNCKEPFELKYTPQKKSEEKKAEPIIAPPTPKEEPKPAPVITPPEPTPAPTPPLAPAKIGEDDCKQFALKTLRNLGQDNYCKTDFGLAQFNDKAKEEFSSAGKEKDYDDCSPFVFSSEFNIAKSACPPQRSPVMVKKVTKVNWTLVLLIAGGILLLAVAVVIIVLVLRRRKTIVQEPETEERPLAPLEETAEVGEKTEAQEEVEQPEEVPELEEEPAEEKPKPRVFIPPKKKLKAKKPEESEEELEEGIKIKKIDLNEPEEDTFAPPKIEVPPIRESKTKAKSSKKKKK